jgi:SAM-dependent methyltransferase
VSYYNSVNQDLLLLSPPARRVLEVGCGEGAFAAAYRERHPGGEYVGIELHAPAAAQARSRVDRLIAGDFELIDDGDIADGAPFDLIIMGDVLEHLRDTDAALAKVHRLLARQGHFVLCVPNIAHWTSFFHLLQGRWPQESEGLFDRTHLRFFTRDSAVEALQKNGFRPLKQRPRQFLIDDQKAGTWLPQLADLAERVGVDRRAFLERGAALQYIFVAEKAEVPPSRAMQLVTAAMAPQMMDARAILPAQHLRSHPKVHIVYQENNLALPAPMAGMANILVLQRTSAHRREDWKRKIAGALRQGWLVISEYDDHPELVGDVLDLPADSDRWLQIEGVHAVQTSTERLAALFAERNPTVRAFPNSAFTLPPWRPSEGKPPRVFFGALHRGPISADLGAALAPAIAACPDAEFDIVFDKALFDALPTGRKRFRETLSYAEYLDAIGRSDVALLLLEGRPLELFKSDLKYVECASRSTAVIASPAVYEATIEHERTGLIAHRLEDWSPALVRLLNDDSLRSRLSRNAWEEVRDHRMFSAQVEARVQWYDRLWDDRERLHAALLARCPWLAD